MVAFEELKPTWRKRERERGRKKRAKQLLTVSNVTVTF